MPISGAWSKVRADRDVSRLIIWRTPLGRIIKRGWQLTSRRRLPYADEPIEHVLSALGNNLLSVTVPRNDTWDAILRISGRPTSIGIDSVSCRASNGRFIVPRHRIATVNADGEKIEGVTLAWCRDYDVFVCAKSTAQGPRFLSVFSATLRSANKLGFGSECIEPGLAVVSFGPSFLHKYLKDVEAVHALAGSNRTLNQVIHALEAGDQKPVRGAAAKSLFQELSSSAFRDNVLRAYGYSCAFCGTQLELLDAAHVIPREYEVINKVTNGIALCASHHRAYDRSLIEVDESYQIVVNDERVKALRQMALDGGLGSFRKALPRTLVLPEDPTLHPNREYLAKGRTIRREKIERLRKGKRR